MSLVRLTCQNRREADGSRINYEIDSDAHPELLSLSIFRQANGKSVHMICVEVCPVDGEYETKIVKPKQGDLMLAAGIRLHTFGDEDAPVVSQLPIPQSEVDGFSEEIHRISDKDMEASILAEIILKD